MKRTRALLAPFLLAIALTTSTFAKIIVYVNQVGFDARSTKEAFSHLT